MSKLTKEQRKISNDLYYNPKTGYVGIDALKRKSELPRKTVENYLVQQPTYTKHKPAIRKFPTRKVIVNGLNRQWQADLADMRNLSQYNDGYNYILTCIDVLSKYALAIGIKRKTGDYVIEAFKTIFQEKTPQNSSKPTMELSL